MIANTGNKDAAPVPNDVGVEKQGINEQKSSMSKEQLLNEFLMIERRVQELEDMNLQHQKVYRRGNDNVLQKLATGQVSLDLNMPIKIQIHQEEIERLKKENKRLHEENRKLRRIGR